MLTSGSIFSVLHQKCADKFSDIHQFTILLENIKGHPMLGVILLRKLHIACSSKTNGANYYFVNE